MNAGKPTSGLQFLDPAVISRLGTMELKARTIVEGFLSGLHRSPYRGFSVEFAEYRQYMPGDDLSTIDWKGYARSDRYYVKKYEEETNLDCYVLLDISASMGYASNGVTKAEYGSYLAGALAYLMNRQRDAVGLATFDDRLVDMRGASSRPGHLRSLLVMLNDIKLGQLTNVSKPLHHLAEALVKRGLIVLISDLLDDPQHVIDGLKHFRYKGTDVIVFHVLDHAELTFPFKHASRFRDLESDEEVLAVPSVVREHYLSEMRGLIELYTRELKSANIDYCVLDTSEPLEFGLLSYLSSRGRA